MRVTESPCDLGQGLHSISVSEHGRRGRKTVTISLSRNNDCWALSAVADGASHTCRSSKAPPHQVRACQNPTELLLPTLLCNPLSAGGFDEQLTEANGVPHPCVCHYNTYVMRQHLLDLMAGRQDNVDVPERPSQSLGIYHV